VSDGAGLDEASRTAAGAWLERTPASKVLFVRRPGRAQEPRVAFVVRASETSAQVRRLDLDEASLAGADLDAGGALVDSPLVLVCGHGTRDACCALRGSAVFGALGTRLPPESLWLSSHQGGHRFAANVLVLPAGIQLGRVSPGDAAGLVGDALAGRIPLRHYRGRTAFTRREQAAEHVLRSSLGLVGIADLALVDDDGTIVRFTDAEGREHGAVPAESSSEPLPASCGAEPERQRHLVARLS
jgi:hypothetical protein